MSLDDPARAPFAEADLPWSHPLFSGLPRLGRRIKQGDRNHPWLLDTAVIAMVALMFCAPDLVHDHDGQRRGFDNSFIQLPWPATLALQAGLILPLLWRRRRPTLAFALIAAVFFVQAGLGVWLRADVALLISLYSLVLHGQLRRLPVACAVTVAALGLFALRLPSQVPVLDALFVLSSTITAAVALGFVVRIRRAQLAVLRDRAARLEIERDQRSKLAAAAERTRVAREMHDIIGHNLSVIITLADGGAYAADLAPSAASRPSSSSVTPAARRSVNCAACWACCACRPPRPTPPNSAPSRASPTSTPCAPASVRPVRRSCTAPAANRPPWTAGSS